MNTLNSGERLRSPIGRYDMVSEAFEEAERFDLGFGTYRYDAGHTPDAAVVFEFKGRSGLNDEDIAFEISYPERSYGVTVGEWIEGLSDDICVDKLRMRFTKEGLVADGIEVTKPTGTKLSFGHKLSDTHDGSSTEKFIALLAKESLENMTANYQRTIKEQEIAKQLRLPDISDF